MRKRVAIELHVVAKYSSTRMRISIDTDDGGGDASEDSEQQSAGSRTQIV